MRPVGAPWVPAHELGRADTPANHRANPMVPSAQPGRLDQLHAALTGPARLRAAPHDALIDWRPGRRAPRSSRTSTSTHASPVSRAARQSPATGRPQAGVRSISSQPVEKHRLRGGLRQRSHPRAPRQEAPSRRRIPPIAKRGPRRPAFHAAARRNGTRSSSASARTSRAASSSPTGQDMLVAGQTGLQMSPPSSTP